MEPLSPYALGTLDDLLRHLKVTGGAQSDDRDRAVESGNRAVGWMERHTTRALRVRTHRNTVTISGTWTTTAVVTGTGFTAAVKAHDDILGVGLEIGSRVLSVDSNTQITLDRLPTAAGTGVTLTVGSRPLTVDGRETSDLWIPEYPVSEVYGTKWRDTAGTLTALDLTGASLERETGHYLIPNDVAPKGEHNIEIECLAGYTPPSATTRGDWSDWENLKGLWLRISEVFYQEKKSPPGRRISQNLGQSSWSTDPRMPDDVMSDIEYYARRP